MFQIIALVASSSLFLYVLLISLFLYLIFGIIAR